jgi:hypothetical protein
VSELPLNDDERHAFASHLDGVGGATGVERTFDEPAAAAVRRSSARAAALDD